MYNNETICFYTNKSLLFPILALKLKNYLPLNESDNNDSVIYDYSSKYLSHHNEFHEFKIFHLFVFLLYLRWNGKYQAEN